MFEHEQESSTCPSSWVAILVAERRRVAGNWREESLCEQVTMRHHVAVVKGWWSAIIIMLLWSGVGGQLLSSCCCGQFLVVNCEHVL